VPDEVWYLIESEPMRPLGRFKFAARPVFQSKLHEREFAEDPPAYEFWGETEEEAITKVREAVRAWAERVGVSAVEV